MRRMGRSGVCLSLVALGLSGLILYGQPPPARQPVEATVISITGTVEVKLAPEADWQPVQAGMKIPQGATISTGVRSKVELDFDGHSLVIIRRPSILRIDRSLITKEAVHTRLHLKVGSLRAAVVKESITSDFRITTPAVTLSIRGTEIADITHSERGTEVLMGKEGLLDMTKFFSPVGVTRSIPPGGFTRSPDLIQVVDAKKMGQSSRSHNYGQTDDENKSASGDPSHLEHAKVGFIREAGHPEVARMLHQEALTSITPNGDRNGQMAY